MGKAAAPVGLIIHLERSQERAPQVEKLRAALPISSQILPAIDGRDLNETDIHHFYVPRLHRPFYPFTLSRTEIACFLSHRRAWATLVEQDLEIGLIVEDDVEILADFDAALALGCNFLKNQDGFIRFPVQRREKGKRLADHHGIELIRPRPVGLGMQMSLVSRATAERLLDVTATFDRPVDTMLQMFWHTSVQPLCLRPSCIGELSKTLGGSTIQKKRKGVKKLRHEILRPLYRWQVCRYSTKFATV